MTPVDPSIVLNGNCERIDLDKTIVHDKYFKCTYHPFQILEVGEAYLEKRLKDEEIEGTDKPYETPKTILDLEAKIEELKSKKVALEAKPEASKEEIETLEAVLGYTVSFRDLAEDFSRKMYDARSAYCAETLREDNKHEGRLKDENRRYKAKIKNLEANKAQTLADLLEQYNSDLAYLRDSTQSWGNYAKFMLTVSIPALLTAGATYLGWDKNVLLSVGVGLITAFPIAAVFKYAEYKQQSALKQNYVINRDQTEANFEPHFEDADDEHDKIVNGLENRHDAREEMVKRSQEDREDRIKRRTLKRLLLYVYTKKPEAIDLKLTEEEKEEFSVCVPST